MKSHHPIGCSCNTCETDRGPQPFAANIMGAARQNQNFRTASWTGSHLQMTLMSIPPCGEIGVEMHPDTDQMIRIEEGAAIIRMGGKEQFDTHRHLGTGDAVFVPCGTWHNVINSGNCPLKISSFYAPPQHPRGTIHRTKEEAARETHEAHG